MVRGDLATLAQRVGRAMSPAMSQLRSISPGTQPKQAMPPARRFAAITRFAVVLGGVLTLTACSEGKYPSLTDRAMMQPTPAAPLPSAIPPEAVSPALTDQLANLLKQANAAHDAFLAHRAAVAQLVDAAHEAPVPSDAWTAANEALAELESDRTDTIVALTRLQSLYVDDRVAHAVEDGNTGTTGSRPVGAAISAAREQVAALASNEDEVLTDLKTRLPD